LEHGLKVAEAQKQIAFLEMSGAVQGWLDVVQVQRVLRVA